MANPFVNFLSQAVNASGNLRDYQHASRLYTANNYDFAPKAGWLYYVSVNINPAIAGVITDSTLQAEFDAWYMRYGGQVGLLAKSVDLPKFNIETEILNQYNRKTVIQKKINYTALSIAFHDDMANATTNLWKSYYQYYYADSLAAINSGIASSIIPKYVDTKYNDYNYDSYGLNNSQSVPFFSSIDVYQLNRKQFTSFKLVNPLIKDWAHDPADQTQGNKMMSSRMTVDYETVIYNTSPNNKNTIQNPGFAANHYDTTPSPLSIGGQGTNSILGPGGLVAGASDVFGSLANIGSASPLDLLNTAIKGANLIRNAKTISSAGIAQEATGLLTGALGTISASPAAVKNPDGTFSTVSSSDRLANGATAAMSGIQQAVSPIGVSFSSVPSVAQNTIFASLRGTN